MTILRHYTMIARDGADAELHAALLTLGAQVLPLAGCEGVDLYRDPDARERFVFIERWSSLDAHKAAGKALGREAFAPVMAVLAQPPKGRYLEPA